MRRRINERTLLADISGWKRRRRLVRRFAVAAAGTPTVVAPARDGGGSDGSLSSWAALQDTIWHCTLRRSDYLESMRSWAAKGQLISKANFEVFILTKNQQKYFCISASISGQINEIQILYYDNNNHLVLIYLLFWPLLGGFLKLGQKYKNISLIFWFKWKLQNLLSKLTDLYILQTTVSYYSQPYTLSFYSSLAYWGSLLQAWACRRRR